MLEAPHNKNEEVEGQDEVRPLPSPPGRPSHWYLGSFHSLTMGNLVNDAVSFLVLFSYIIPIR